MTVEHIDGNALAKKIRLAVRSDIVENNIDAGLAIILVGSDEASHLYVKLKEKACKEVGIDFHKYLLDSEVSQEHLEEVISYLNNDTHITGILLQLPLPSHLDENSAVAKIGKIKDVDGFGPENIADFMSYKAELIPGLPNGIYELIKSTGEPLEDKHCVVVANSEVFARPIANMMTYKGATAEYIHPDNNNLIVKTKAADIIIIAVGRKWFLTKDMIKPDSIIIDVGTNRISDSTYGDVNPNVDEVAAYRSPVPGGVGPMTIAMLLQNTLTLYRLQRNRGLDIDKSLGA